ncbi:hypothetical protein AN958_10416 [Leucoagaricus sp. SymC.cos]|nr:hypothetical protein AN958_10416 [Leucoagaricus sp. SymC.cos]
MHRSVRKVVPGTKVEEESKSSEMDDSNLFPDVVEEESQVLQYDLPDIYACITGRSTLVLRNLNIDHFD